MKEIFKFYFSFRGRVGLKSFWLGLQGPWLIMNIFLGLSALSTGGNYAGMIFPNLAFVGVLSWPFTAVYIKRLHDINRSGWCLLVPVLGTLLFIPSIPVYSEQIMVLCKAVVGLYCVWMLFSVSFLDSADNGNRYNIDTDISKLKQKNMKRFLVDTSAWSENIYIDKKETSETEKMEIINPEFSDTDSENKK